MLSCSVSPDLTVIVGDTDGTFTINKKWELITIGTQWTRYSAMILSAIPVNGSDNALGERTFDHPQVYLFRQRNADLPTDTIGYVYCLYLVPKCHLIYIGSLSSDNQRY